LVLADFGQSLDRADRRSWFAVMKRWFVEQYSRKLRELRAKSSPYTIADLGRE